MNNNKKNMKNICKPIEQNTFSSFFGEFNEGEDPLQAKCCIANTGVSHHISELAFVSVRDLFNDSKEIKEIGKQKTLLRKK